ncbi:MAG: MmcQ/YjbR family DNA-binding protein [Lachnospiraceae bacterium]|nr:MmcQ/YjbR family DNA-binding protein [Lachnospiraceae bacterium]
MSLRDDVFAYVKKKYKAEPEYLWRSWPDYAVFRHAENRKWFGIVMNVPESVLGLAGNDATDILNVKVDDPILLDLLLRQSGYFPGWHMNRRNWISILLDGTVGFDEICGMIDASFLATAPREKKVKMRPAKEWIVPANPKFYDVEGAFAASDEVDWKQGAGIKVGDTVYMYVAAPVSAILYKCRVTETDIPYAYADENLTIKALMRLRLQRRYERDRFTFERLCSEFGVTVVRGPRGVPYGLSEELKK